MSIACFIRWQRISVFFALSLLPVFANATTVPGSVTFGSDSALPVPTLTPAILVALGLFLAVVAIRSLRQHDVARRLISISMFAVGATMALIGGQKTIAGADLISTPTDCQPGSDVVVNIDDIFSETEVSNQCPIDLFLKSYQFDCAAVVATAQLNGTSPVGTPFPAGTDLEISRCVTGDTVPG